MSLIHSDDVRRMVPRWRASEKVAGSPEFQSLGKLTPVRADLRHSLENAYHAFIESPSIGSASEVLSASLMTGDRQKTEEAIRFILDGGDTVPDALNRMAGAILLGSANAINSALTEREEVAAIRELIRINPDNPMLWSDLARHHAAKGNKKTAGRCMTVALGLAPNHRWLLRSAARFYVHEGSKDIAHRLLHMHPRTKVDPWLIAAEIACANAAGRSPKYWTQAKRMVHAGGLAPRHMSELYTSMAMLELESGGSKRARKLVEKGLVEPTENTLAQVFWAIKNKHLRDGDTLPSLISRAQNAYEADCRLNLSDGLLLEAQNQAIQWGADEPFAARPRLEHAYIASLLDDYRTTIAKIDEVARIDNQIDPNSEMNRIYALISSNELDMERDRVEIERMRKKITETMTDMKDSSFHPIANLGLWNYRYGDKAEGKRLYREAIEKARLHNNADSVAMAAVFAAREAILAGDQDAGIDLHLASKLVERSGGKASKFYLKCSSSDLI